MLRYKLRYFGVLVDGHAEVFCDKKSVFNNSIIPISVLNYRHDYICYHRVREARSEVVFCVGRIPGGFNLAYLFTKTVMPGNTKHSLVELVVPKTASPIGDIKTA